MRVFLTGINGFLGRHVALRLTQAGYDVVGLVRSNDRPECLSEVPIKYCEGDLINPSSYEKCVQKCDVVIHTAAISTFELRGEKKLHLINTDATKELLSICASNGIKRFVFISTRGTLTVASNPAETCEVDGYKRSDEMDAYFYSKYIAEKEVLRYASSGKLSCVVLSPTAMIGIYDDVPTPIGNIILSYLQGRIKIYMDGGINLVDVTDVASACVSALTRGISGEVYIIGNTNISLHEIFRQLSLAHSVKLPKIKIPYFVAYIIAFLLESVAPLFGKTPFSTTNKVVSLSNNFSYCSSNKAVDVLKLKQRPIIETLQKTTKWFCKQHHITTKNIQL